MAPALGWRGILAYLIGFAAMTPFFSIVNRPGFVGGYDALASGMIVVCSLRVSHAFSYSAGGIFPQAEWSLSSLYQDTHSAAAMVTCPASCHGPSLLMSSFL